MRKLYILLGLALLAGCDSTSDGDKAGGATNAHAQITGNSISGEQEGARADSGVPDGAYSCSKIEGGGGNYLHIGDATIQSGRVTSLALPEGWEVVSVTPGAPNDWSKTVAELSYRTASGNTDKLECTPK